MEFISGTALTHLLGRAHAREDLRLDLPDGMGRLVVSFVEGSQAVMVWREGELDLDFVDLLCFHQARIAMALLPDALTEVWRRHYDDRQTQNVSSKPRSMPCPAFLISRIPVRSGCLDSGLPAPPRGRRDCVDRHIKKKPDATTRRAAERSEPRT
jgi:hypothetical protein